MSNLVTMGSVPELGGYKKICSMHSGEPTLVLGPNSKSFLK